MKERDYCIEVSAHNFITRCFYIGHTNGDEHISLVKQTKHLNDCLDCSARYRKAIEELKVGNTKFDEKGLIQILVNLKQHADKL